MASPRFLIGVPREAAVEKVPARRLAAPAGDLGKIGGWSPPGPGDQGTSMLVTQVVSRFGDPWPKIHASVCDHENSLLLATKMASLLAMLRRHMVEEA
jgi:hypothetical protein